MTLFEATAVDLWQAQTDAAREYLAEPSPAKREELAMLNRNAQAALDRIRSKPEQPAASRMDAGGGTPPRRSHRQTEL